ncbi:hypothetical protein AKJ13_29830 [Methylobacterium sp. ARG-1]|nr:hypothetical protein AKJ13_29830 [Methylobacterium sp. ARG-1]
MRVAGPRACFTSSCPFWNAKSQDLKLDVAQFTHEEAVRAAHYLAYVVSKAHGRQMDGRQA